MNDTRPVTSINETPDQQPLHIGGAAAGVVIPASDVTRASATGVAEEPSRFDSEGPVAVEEEPAAPNDETSEDFVEPAPPVAGDQQAGEEDDEADTADTGLVEPAEPIPELPLFSELGLSDELVRAVTEKGYLHPTPIQAQAIPFILMGRDLMGVAQTGTGKTASFTLPLLDILSGSRARARMPRSLILEPTRELALQVAENFVDYGRHLKLTHALIIGGESMNDQRAALDKGVDVLIATPGRLLDLFERGGLMLNDAKFLVIDEADRMLDMGFIPDVEKIVSFVSPMRQTLFFSATMAPEIRRLADAFLQNPKLITVSRAATVATTIVAGLAVVDEHDKRRALRTLLGVADVSNALIFCNRKRDVDILHKSLIKHGFSAGALHGDLPQSVRFATLEKFKAGEIRMLVCSDVAARGIDIGGLSHVFNFDIPIHAEDYVHRIGRTGRAGRTGHAYSIATPDDRLVVDAIETLTGTPIPRIAVEGVDTQPWSEIDGRKRRSGRRGAGPSGERVPAERSGRDRPRGRGDRSRDAPTAETRRDRPEQQPRPERVRREREPAPARVDRDARPVEALDASVPAVRFDRDRPRRDGDRYRREDLGPSVVGFGDAVPDFMNLPRRAAVIASSGDSFVADDPIGDDVPSVVDFEVEAPEAIPASHDATIDAPDADHIPGPVED